MVSGQHPLPFRQIHRAFRLASSRNRGKKNIIAEHILIPHVVDNRILRVIEEQRPHHGNTRLRSYCHVLSDIGAQPLSEHNQVFQNGEVSFSKAPDLIISAGGFQNIPGSVVAVPAAMETHNGAEYSILEPANNQFAEFIGFDIAAVEASNISGPPRNAADGHIKPRLDLCLQTLESRRNISRPH